jgi:hypothetical protein
LPKSLSRYASADRRYFDNALAYNMKRMINLFGVKPLMQAIAA